MSAPLQKIASSATAEDMATILERDGAVIVENALSERQLTQLNQEMDRAIADVEPGLRTPAAERFVEFYGKQTIRIDGLPAKSKAFWSIMESSFMTRIADHLLLPNCEHYLLNTGQLIQIGPGETAQALHRDEDAWSYYKDPKSLLQVEAMFALTDFTVDNGATQVVPGSHRWPRTRAAEAHEIQRAEMAKGSALLYLGTTLHGGGANITQDQWRRGMFFGFVVGWLRTEENFYLTVPIEMVQEMPERLQTLLGYKAHGGIGVVDVGSPTVVLSK